MTRTESLISPEKSKDHQIADLEQALRTRDEKIKNCEGRISWLTEQLKTLQRAQYGRKSERWESQEQLVIPFNEAEVEAARPDGEAEEEAAATEVRGHSRKARGHREALPEHLPREV